MGPNGVPPPAAACAEDLMIALRMSTELLPVVDRVVRAPCYDIVGGRLVRSGPGLDVVRRRYVEVPNYGILPPADPHYPLLKAWFSGLLWQDPTHYANWLGTICAAWARTAIEAFPILLLDSNKKSAGKTYTAESFCRLFMGVPKPAITYSGTEGEMETRFGGYCASQQAPVPIMVDNIRCSRRAGGRMHSSALCAATSSHFSAFRKLYHGMAGVSDPIFVFTMNRAKLDDDLFDKTQTFSLYLPPELRNRKLVPMPVRFVERNRLGLIAEIEDILSKITLPADLPTTTRFYEFQAIAQASAALLGMCPNFDPSLFRVMNPAAEEMLCIMLDDFAGHPVQVDSLFDKVQAQGEKLPYWNDALHQLSGSDKSRKRLFPDMLQDLCGQEFRWGAQREVYSFDLKDGLFSVTRKEIA
jgi:hypothetical protein